MGLKSALVRIPGVKAAYGLVHDLNRQSIFEDWCSTNQNRGLESKSGPGSSLFQTHILRAELEKLIPELQITSLLDIPCGDFNWMKDVNLEDVRYIGADILRDVVAENRKKYGSSVREFRLLDLTRDRLPRTDLILCRDCLPHFSYRLIRKALAAVKHSGGRYFLTTTFLAHNENVDTYTGNWRPLSLSAPPFGFPPPSRLIDERCPEEGYQDKSLALWTVDSIPPA